MSVFTWETILDYSFKACGESTGFRTEQYDHLNAALRQLSMQVDVEELFERETLSVTAGTDNVTLPTDLFHVEYVFNKSEGERVEPEEAGMRGRSAQLLIGTGLPPAGIVYRYALSGGKMYVRDTPTSTTSLLVEYKKYPADISSSDLSSNPITPRHLDWALVHMISANYFAIRVGDGEPERATQARERMMHFKQLAQAEIAQQQVPFHEENMDRRHGVRQMGYRFVY